MATALLSLAMDTSRRFRFAELGATRVRCSPRLPRESWAAPAVRASLPVCATCGRRCVFGGEEAPRSCLLLP